MKRHGHEKQFGSPSTYAPRVALHRRACAAASRQRLSVSDSPPPVSDSRACAAASRQRLSVVADREAPPPPVSDSLSWLTESRRRLPSATLCSPVSDSLCRLPSATLCVASRQRLSVPPPVSDSLSWLCGWQHCQHAAVGPVSAAGMRRCGRAVLSPSLAKNVRPVATAPLLKLQRRRLERRGDLRCFAHYAAQRTSACRRASTDVEQCGRRCAWTGRAGASRECAPVSAPWCRPAAESMDR